MCEFYFPKDESSQMSITRITRQLRVENMKQRGSCCKNQLYKNSKNWKKSFSDPSWQLRENPQYGFVQCRFHNMDSHWCLWPNWSANGLSAYCTMHPPGEEEQRLLWPICWQLRVLKLELISGCPNERRIELIRARHAAIRRGSNRIVSRVADNPMSSVEPPQHIPPAYCTEGIYWKYSYACRTSQLHWKYWKTKPTGLRPSWAWWIVANSSATAFWSIQWWQTKPASCTENNYDQSQTGTVAHLRVSQCRAV